jgi:hypothetical protein
MTTITRVIASTFIVLAVVSVFATSYLTYLLFAAHDVAGAVGASILDITLLSSDSSNPEVNVTVLVENPTAYPLRLSYVKIVTYVSGNSTDARESEKLQSWKDFSTQPIRMPPVSNASVSIEVTEDVNLAMPLYAPKSWFVIIYILLYDVPLTDRAYFTRYSYFVTSF